MNSKENIETNNNIDSKLETKETDIKNSIESKDRDNNKQESSLNSNSTIVTVYRNNGDVLKLELEEYIIGVVASEMPASFNIEALKAQSILSRTYALKAIKSNKKLTDTVSTQVYKDSAQLKKMWGNNYDVYYNKIKKAIESTKGKTIKYNNEYIEAVFHSTSNGFTENSKEVWGNYFPYLVSVESKYDTNVNSFSKTISISYEELSSKLGIILNKDSSVEYIKNESGRISNITIDGISFKGTTFRNKLGLRSTDFELIFNDNDVTINTRGYGHGVGMSQYGANEMAKLGMSYKDIIYYYYTGVSIN